MKKIFLMSLHAFLPVLLSVSWFQDAQARQGEMSPYTQPRSDAGMRCISPTQDHVMSMLAFVSTGDKKGNE